MRQDVSVPRPDPTWIYHMTRIERLPTIIECGLLPDNEVQRRTIEGTEIGYRHIKDRRANRMVSCGAGGSLADYVPFYFAPRSPMLYAITQGQVSPESARTSEIVYLATTTQDLRAAGLVVVVSNRHAELAYAELSDADSVLDGDGFVDWPLMLERYWKDTSDYPDKKERRQAECLAHPVVGWSLIRGVVAKTDEAARRVSDLFASSGVRTPVTVRPNWYF